VDVSSLQENPNIRNIAIIAHVDHGKTTLVDHMLRQSGIFRSGQAIDERIMDSMDLERERGITIAAKNCAIYFKDVKINIIDTPGHADFGGEVERALKMVDGAVLLVDASEGPLPQTRFVLNKALEQRLRILVVINKIDRQDARPREVLNEIYDLFIDLDATDDQIEFPVLYAIGRDGVAQRSLDEPGTDLEVLFETILAEIPPPRFDSGKALQLLITNLAYSDYLGRLAIGKIFQGSAGRRDELVCLGGKDEVRPVKLSQLQVYDGLQFRSVDSAAPGDIVVLAGVDEVEIGDTICTRAAPEALKRIIVDEPTVAMKFTINSSPFAGREGSIVQSRKIAERLQKEVLHNVALKVEAGSSTESFTVKGRGEFQMAILLETMRREGFELSVGRPQIIYKEENGSLLEPIEHVFIDCDEEFTGVVTEKVSLRKGRMVNLVNHGSGRVRLEFSVPSRGLIGFRGEFLTDTKGTGIMNSYLEAYDAHRGDFPSRTSGSIVSDREGAAVAYALFHLEPRGTLFVKPGDKVYRGMIVGEHNRDTDLYVNPCKEKKLSNMRAAGKDDNVLLTPATTMTLEHSLEFIRDDELIEITPKSIRLRKESLG